MASYLIESRAFRRRAGRRAVPVREHSVAGRERHAASGVPPSSVPAVTPVSTAGGAEIYQWLPFTAADLSAAAQTTLTFAKDYSTWSYTESVTDYGAKLSPLVTTQELATLKSGYSTAGVAGPRVRGQAGVHRQRHDRLDPLVRRRSVSITFVVTINQQVTSTQPARRRRPQQYAVTVVSSGGAWQVSDLELSQLGNT